MGVNINSLDDSRRNGKTVTGSPMVKVIHVANNLPANFEIKKVVK